MSLPEVDIAFLDERCIAHEIVAESGMTCIVIPDWQLSRRDSTDPAADLLVRLTPGYPDVPPDMWWFDPPVLKADGQALPRTNVREHYLGRTWQRWSRHFSGAQWKSGVDCLESYLALIRQNLVRGLNGAG